MFLPAFLLAFDVFGVFQTLEELGFVLQVIVFSYLLFWLYMTLREAELLFGLAALVVGYLIFIHGLSVTALAIVFLFFVVLGNQLQMILMFGLLPLLGYHYLGDRYVKMPSTPSQQALEAAQRRQEAGIGRPEDNAMLQQYYQQAQQAGVPSAFSPSSTSPFVTQK